MHPAPPDNPATPLVGIGMPPVRTILGSLDQVEPFREPTHAFYPADDFAFEPDDCSGLAAWVDDDGRFFAVGADGTAREYGDGDAEGARLAADMHGDGRRHDPLRDGKDQAAGHRRARNAWALPLWPRLRAGRSMGGAGGDRAPASPFTDPDHPDRIRSVWPDAGLGQRRRDRPELLAGQDRPRAIRGEMGQRPPAGGDLPPAVADPLGRLASGVDPLPFRPSRPERAAIIAASALAAWTLVGLAAALIAGRL